VDDCANWVVNFQGNPPPEIKVALIDDGVDAGHEQVMGNIQEGTTYCLRHGRKEPSSSYFVSTSGHGTLMATQIRRVCPAAKLYIAKLDDYQGENGSLQITAESAAKV
jgi:hypothetical protein